MKIPLSRKQCANGDTAFAVPQGLTRIQVIEDSADA